MLQFVYFVVACVGNDGKPERPVADSDETPEEDPYISSTATFTVNPTVDEDPLAPLPLTVYRGGDVLYVGQTGTTVATGTGPVRFVVGPEVMQTDPEHSYYPGEDGYTDDGVMLIIHDYLRLVSLPVETQVALENTVVDYGMNVAAGDGYYDCEGRIKELDRHTDEEQGDGEPWSYEGGFIALREGRKLVPANSTAHFTSFFSPGDALVVKGSHLDFESTSGNEIVDHKRDGTGSNDILFTYHNHTTLKALEVECRYDWSEWRATYY